MEFLLQKERGWIVADQPGSCTKRTCIRGGIVYQPNGRFAPSDVWIRDGNIEQVGEGEPRDPGPPPNVIDAAGHLVVPGLINAHFHSHGVLSRGSFHGAPLELWSLRAAAGRARLDPEEVYTTCQLACFEVLRLGVSTLLDHTYFSGEQLDACVQAYADAGLRVNIAPCLSDRTYPETLPLTGGETALMSQWKEKAPDPEHLLQMCESLVQRWHGAENGRVRIMAGASAPHRCSETLLTGLAGLASRHQLGIHTHLLETRVQAITAREFYGCGMTMYLDKVGLLGPRSSLAHGIWLTPEELSLIRSRQATVVHNPFSNVFLGSGVAPVTAMRRAGIHVALGTDGPNCGGSLNLFEAMRWAIGLQRLNDVDHEQWLSSSDALEMLWRGGAEALALGDEIGGIASGRKADL
ncbi:MAG: hypothetical protein A2170_09275, partial [Deltaproteobacteria bacterium RBG_13_53_10]